MKERVYCLNHPQTYAVNAKKLCGVCTKERHEKSAESKGILTKSARNKENIAIFKKKEDGFSKVHNGFGIGKLSTKAKKSFKKTKINTVSKDKASELRTLAKIKKRKISLQGKECELCGTSGEVDLFHIITVGDKRFSINENNLLLSCRSCHDIWGDNDWSKIIKFKNFGEIMERLKSLDECKYWKIWHKIEPFIKG